ncbi:AAA family ATPase [Acinetobacter pittii]|uniref:AAA family ATPase n=1 Tax=Acinetobacter calcoaceticus/baumannii complex TaxID=909768 RepID=UPI001EFCACB5|nr:MULTISPECIES: AAA family ATPase [Acinetobacter calcoaceticus/baumannii complex]MCG9493368.1 AAA family ATPase [Acinetobacter pittii]MCU4346727.1 AAA family ATPase [Acinetobacter lactucae]
MTFASDRISANQETLAKQRYDMQSKERIARTSRFSFDPDLVMQHVRDRIIGQAEALEEIENMLMTIKADFNSPNRPLSVTLMLGPTGVGKTETVRLIAEAIHGKPDAFCRIDMNTLAQEHYAAALTGAPPGYVGSKESNTLFDETQIQGSFSKPGIVLFDEIEKASTEVIRGLLNVLETGTLKLTAGTKVLDFKNCMIFMTSNIGAKDAQTRLKQLSKLPKAIQQLARFSKLDDSEIINKALHKKFDPEFLNRIERILHFQAIDTYFASALVDLEVDKLNQRLRKQSRTVELTASANTFLSTGHDVRFGARGLGRRFRVLVEPKLAKFLIQNPEANHIIIDYNAQNLNVRSMQSETVVKDQNLIHEVLDDSTKN